MTTRRWKAACIGMTITTALVILTIIVGVRIRGSFAPGGELLAAYYAGVFIWWIMDIKAHRDDKAERRRQEIMNRNRH